MIELDPREALDVTTLAAITTPMRLHSIFIVVANALPVEKREITASLQRLRKRGAIRCDLDGKWHVKR